MSILKIFCTILLLSAKNYAEEYTGDTVEEYINKKIEFIASKTTELIQHDIIKLREPAASIACDKTNGNKIKIIRDIDGYFFFLSLNELFAIRVGTDNVAHLYFIGTLLDIDQNDDIIDIQMEKWKNFYLVIIQQQSKLKIYLVKFDVSDSPDINHIQKIDINSVADKFKVFVKGEDVIMVIYRINEKSANELIFYTWQTSYFSKEITEQAELPNKSDLFVFNENAEESIILSIGYGVGNQSTQVVAFKFDQESNRWLKLQKMRFKQDYIQQFSVHGKLYLIGCYTDAFCAIYKWTNSSFRRHQKISNNVFEIIKSIYSHHSIVIVENFQNKLSFYSTSDITGIKPGIVILKSEGVTEYSTYKSKDGYLYFVQVSRNDSSIQTNFYEMSIIDGSAHENKADSKELDPIECVMQLKAAMKNRVASVKSSERNAMLLVNNPGILDIQKKKYITARYVNIKNSIVRKFKMPYNVSVLKSEMSEKIVSSNIKLEQIRKLIDNTSTWNSRERAEENLNGDFGLINVKNLIYKGNQPLFKGIVRKSQSKINFIDQIRLANITSNKLDIKSQIINEIPLNKLLNATTTKSVKGTKNIPILSIDEAKIAETINNVQLTFLNSTENKLKQARRIDFNGDINVEHLNVKVLNGFDVQKVMNDLYLKKNQTTVRGDLFVRNIFNVNHLFANQIKSVSINDLLTTSTDQVVESDVFISKFHATTMNVTTVNGEDMSNYALSHGKKFIEVPTKFEFLTVQENLKIEDLDMEDNSKAIRSFINAVRERVIGTNESDLAQFYNGRVVIQGTLKVNDLNAFSPKTKIVVADHPIRLNITANYLTKSTKQEIFVDTFTILSETKLNGIVTKYFNGHPANNYLRLDAQDDHHVVNLRFNNSIVKGDIKGDKNNIPSILLELSKSVIRIDGPPTAIASSIEFRNKLAIKNLYTATINGISVKGLVHKHLNLVLFEAPKIVKSIEVKGDIIVDDDIKIDTYNNINLKSFVNGLMRIDKQVVLEKLLLKSFKASNLTVGELESHNFNEMVENLQEELDISSRSNKGKRTIKIHGDAVFKANIFTDLINSELDFNEFVNLLVINSKNPQEIGGRKIFQGGLIVTENIITERLNGLDTNRLLSHSLNRNDKQSIDTEMFVKNLKIDELRTKILNEIPCNNLIDQRNLHLPLKINVELKEMEAENLYTKSNTIDFAQMSKMIQFPKRENWHSVTAMKGCDIVYGTNTYLDQLLADGVVKSINQEILEEVEFTNLVDMSHIKKQDNLITTRIQTIDMKAFDEDSVKQDSKSELIRGKKYISQGYRFDAKNLIIGPQCNFYSPYINNINITELNQTIFRHGNTLNSVKRFGNLEVDELYIQGGSLNGVPVNSIVTILQDNVKLNNVKFESLEVDNLKTFMFNNYSLLYFLKSRVRKSGVDTQVISNHITFQSLDFKNETEITSINDVNINNAVYLESDRLQVIDGQKVINGNLYIKGPAHIGTINGIDVMEFNKNTINNDQNFRTEIPLKLSQVHLKNGVHVTKSINDRSIDELLSSNAHSPKLNDLVTLIANVTKQISKIDHEKSIKRKKRRMLYIDIDENIDFQYKTPRSSDEKQCLMRNEIDFNPFSKRVLITKKSELEMIVDLPSVRFELQPNFECEDNEVNSKKINFLWNYKINKELSENNFSRNFIFDNKVKEVKFMESSDNQYILIIVLFQKNSSSEISFLRLNQSSNEIINHQPTITGYYETTKIALIYSTDKIHYLVVSTFKQSSEADRVFIYRFDRNQGQFVISQKPFSGGKYDIILGINVKPFTALKGKVFLLFSKTNGKQIKIYQRKDETGEFVFQRMIDDFKDSIVEVLILYINDQPFIIVSQNSGLFCLYENFGIESWKSKYCGRFENIHQMKSFEYLNRQHLFLASMAGNTAPSINALAIYRQGE